VKPFTLGMLSLALLCMMQSPLPSSAQAIALKPKMPAENSKKIQLVAFNGELNPIASQAPATETALHTPDVLLMIHPAVASARPPIVLTAQTPKMAALLPEEEAAKPAALPTASKTPKLKPIPDLDKASKLEATALPEKILQLTALPAPNNNINQDANNQPLDDLLRPLTIAGDQNAPRIADDDQTLPLRPPAYNTNGSSNTNGKNGNPRLTPSTQYPFAPEGELRRGLPAPLDPVFPSTEWIGTAGQVQIGVPNLNPVFPLEKAIYHACPILKKARIEIYGWTNPGIDYSSSHHSNVPLSYSIVPRKLELDQQVIRVDRMPDTVQQERNDWGFRMSMVYGIDTRYTVAAGWYPASGQVLGQNRLYSWDPVECYGVYYVPKLLKRKLFDGLVLKVGRYISPSDIEAQLAPDNYLWTHSLMFTVDNYTQTGMLASLKLNKQWMIQAGIHAGDDIAPWNKAAIPSAIACARWQSKTNNDSLYFTMNSINNGRYRLAKTDGGAHGHDNLQQFNITWGHRFSRRVHTMTEAYFMYELDALTAGTTISGPPKPYFKNVGAGAYLPGFSPAFGVVNYTNFKITDKDYITFRPIDYLGDPRGLRTGFKTTYSSWTVGWCHRFSDLLCIRPEIRYERALNTRDGVAVTPYDNGLRRAQFTFGFDIIQRY